MDQTPELPEQPDKGLVVIPKVVEESDSGIMARWTEAAVCVVTNLDTQSPGGTAMATRCMAQADVKTRAVVGQIVIATAFFAHVVEIINTETGEVTKKVRVVLILKDGRTLSTTSKACVRTISLINQQMKGGKWDPPVRLEVREFPLEGGRSYCDMRMLMPDEKPPTPKK